MNLSFQTFLKLIPALLLALSFFPVNDPFFKASARSRELTNTAVSIKGIITNKTYELCRSRGKTGTWPCNFSAEYVYRIPASNRKFITLKNRQPIDSENLYQSLTVNKPVDIIYAAKNPTLSSIAANHVPGNIYVTWWFANIILFSVFCLLFSRLFKSQKSQVR